MSQNLTILNSSSLRLFTPYFTESETSLCVAIGAKPTVFYASKTVSSSVWQSNGDDKEEKALKEFSMNTVKALRGP